MYRKFNQIVMTAILCGMSLTAMAGGPTDSTQLSPEDVNPVAQPTLLAQGVVVSNPAANYAPITPVQVSQRCGQGSIPYFKSSLVGTYENSFYATGGIVNSLTLTPDYKVEGVIFMSNRGAVGANNYSPVTMNWQVWCTAKQTA